MTPEQALAAEIVLMFETYGITPSPPRVADYVRIVGPCSVAELRQARLEAMAESGRWPPGPGELRAAVLAVRRARPGEAPPPVSADRQITAGDPEADRAVAREFARRLAAIRRTQRWTTVAERWEAAERVSRQLGSDLRTLADARNRVSR